ncbi:hypothetical protein QQP08_018158 [Theobroma cacao]|nr:hypothetical protein QQP08_018158 [Theobroma cacao]
MWGKLYAQRILSSKLYFPPALDQFSEKKNISSELEFSVIEAVSLNSQAYLSRRQLASCYREDNCKIKNKRHPTVSLL